MNDKKIPSRYESLILKEFASRYRSSAHRSGGRKVRISGWDSIFTEIRTSADERSLFLDAMEKLAGEGAISIKWEKFRTGSNLAAAYLENPEKIFDLLGMLSPDDEAKQIAAAVSSDTAGTETAKEIILYIKHLAENKKNIPFISSDDIRDSISLIEEIELREVLPLRALSVKLFANSKRIEQIIPKLEDLLKRIGKKNLLSGLTRSFPDCIIKGNFLIEFYDGRRWEMHNDIISLSLETAKKIMCITPVNKKYPASLCSIENKETFYSIGGLNSFAGYIFCHGHLNEAVKTIILKTYESGNRIFHFGDCDPDGIMIFNEINIIVEGNCTPFMMNEQVYEKYISFGYNLSAAQMSRLPEQAPGLEKLIERIRERRKGIEQEIMDYNKWKFKM